jgi:WD40 repeat protein
LVADAHEDAAYLPLLQVTLEDIWRAGQLTIDHYGNLSHAISKRANEIYQYRQEASGQLVPRTKEEQQLVLEIFLDLVEVSPDKDIKRDVRRRRWLDDVTRGRASVRALIHELSQRRLLSTTSAWIDERNQERQVVDIVHESLITNWEVLQQAIQAQQERLRQRSRFEFSLGQWKDQNRDESYLLSGLRLAEAQALATVEDVAVQDATTKEYLRQSIQKQQRRQRLLLVLAFLIIGALSALTVVSFNAKRESDQQRNELATRRTEIANASSTAESEKVRAEQTAKEARRALANQLASDVQTLLINNTDPSGSLPLMLAKQAVSTTLSPDGYITVNADAALHSAIHNAQPNQIQIVINQVSSVSALAWSPDGAYIATTDDNVIRLWNPKTGAELFQLKGHTDPINALAWSPDGQYIASGSGQVYDPLAPQLSDTANSPKDFTVRIWDVATKREVRRFPDYQEAILSLAWDPDGTYLATASGAIVRIWDVAANTELSPLVGHQSTVNTVAWSPNGQYIATGSGSDVIDSDNATDHSVRIWDVHSYKEDGEFKEYFKFEGHLANVNSVAWSPDSRYVASGSGNIAGDSIETRVSADFSIRIWGIEERNEMQRIDGHTAAIHSVAWSPNGKYLLTTAGTSTAFADRSSEQDLTARIWSLATEQEIFHFTGLTAPALSSAWNPDSTFVAIGSTLSERPGITVTPTVRIWGVQRYEPMTFDSYQSYNWGFAYPSQLAWSKDSHYLGANILVRYGNARSVWDTQTGSNIEPSVVITGDEKLDYVIALSDDEPKLLWTTDQQLALLPNDETGYSATMWNVATNERHELNVSAQSAPSPDGRYIASVEQSRLLIKDSLAITTFQELPDLAGNVTALAWDAGSTLLAAGTDKGVIQIWNVTSGKEIQRLGGTQSRIDAIFWSTTGTYLITGANTRIEVPIQKLNGTPFFLQISRFASVTLWRVTSAQPIYQFADDIIVTKSPWNTKQQFFFLTSADNNIHLWDAQNNQEDVTKQFSGHNGAILDAAWSPDGSFIASASQDQTVKLWDTETGKVLRTWEYPTAVLIVAWSPDGKRLATGDANNTIQVWIADIKDTMALAQSLITRNPPIFSMEEKAQYNLP